MNIQFEVRYTQGAFMAMYAQAYGVPDSTLSKWLKEEEEERRTPEVVKRFRVMVKQWKAWTWHERVKAMDAGFNPGRTYREAFEDVKGWLAHHGDPIDTDVPKIALEHFDEKAITHTKERLAKQREERVRHEREKKENQREELRRLNNRVQELTDLREREIKTYESRIRELERERDEANENLRIQEKLSREARKVSAHCIVEKDKACTENTRLLKIEAVARAHIESKGLFEQVETYGFLVATMGGEGG